MKAVLVIELDDDVNLEEVEIRYAIQDMYGMPVKAEVDGCPLKPLPKEEDIYEVGMDEEDTKAKQQWNKGWNACLKEITDE